MYKVILQLWEQSEINKEIIPVGCSLHIDSLSHKSYINRYYQSLSDEVPDIYSRPISKPIEVQVTKELYAIVSNDKCVVVKQTEMNNLIQLEDIIIC